MHPSKFENGWEGTLSQKSGKRVAVKERFPYLHSPFSDQLSKSRIWELVSLKLSTQIPTGKSSFITTLMRNTDLPENTHPKQETGLRISSPYSHSWEKNKQNTGPVWNHTDNLQAVRWCRQRCVQTQAKAHSPTRVTRPRVRDGNKHLPASESSPERQGKQRTVTQWPPHLLLRVAKHQHSGPYGL